MNVSEMKRCNKVTMICHGVTSGLIVVAYLIEVFKGSRTFPYWLMLAVLGLGPVVVEAIMYNNNPESNALRKVVGYGYAVLYAVAIFSTTSMLPFVYIFPMLIVISLYGDTGYCLKIGIGGFILNVAEVIYRGVKEGYAPEQVADLEIRLIVLLVIVIYLYFVTKVTKQISQDKQEVLKEEQFKIQNLLDRIMNLSGNLTGGVGQVDFHMNRLDKSVDDMSVAMNEVANGTQETAESVQNQLARTEEIQKLIEQVREVGVYIRESMDDASNVVEDGVTNMEKLAKQARDSKEANATVVKLMEELHVQAVKMNEIVGLINSIANKTSMLALNANIEAARAGEAGAGFAVVAMQVSDLASQTKDATVNIGELIKYITDELHQVSNAVRVMEENTEEQSEKTEEMSGSLHNIMDMTINIAGKTSDMEHMIEELSVANEDIVQNIQTISAITEEVTAHSSETLNTCKENQEIVEQVSKITAELNANAQELKNEQA